MRISGLSSPQADNQTESDEAASGVIRTASLVLAACFFDRAKKRPRELASPYCDKDSFLEPIRKEVSHTEAFEAIRLSMMRIMARRMKAATVEA